jgi:hypothetical protein
LLAHAFFHRETYYPDDCGTRDDKTPTDESFPSGSIFFQVYTISPILANVRNSGVMSKGSRKCEALFRIWLLAMIP